MKLNTISPAKGSAKSKNRVGRGPGSGFGKTAGRGHKGQKARSGGGVRPGFEGGQMPFKQRAPKFGFTSRKSFVRKSLRLSDLNQIQGTTVDLFTLTESGLITNHIEFVKIYLSGEIRKPLNVKGISVSAGAKAAIIAAGGTVEELAS